MQRSYQLGFRTERALDAALGHFSVRVKPAAARQSATCDQGNGAQYGYFALGPMLADGYFK